MTPIGWGHLSHRSLCESKRMEGDLKKKKKKKELNREGCLRFVMWKHSWRSVVDRQKRSRLEVRRGSTAALENLSDIWQH